MTWYGSVVYFCWPVGNHHYRVNKPLAGAARATRSTLGVTATQCSSDFLFQLAFSLEIQRLINRFRTHVHSLITGIATAQPPRNLLWRVPIFYHFPDHRAQAWIGINLALFRSKPTQHRFTVRMRGKIYPKFIPVAFKFLADSASRALKTPSYLAYTFALPVKIKDVSVGTFRISSCRSACIDANRIHSST